MKKLSAILLCMLLVLSLSACTPDTQDDKTDESKTQTDGAKESAPDTEEETSALTDDEQTESPETQGEATTYVSTFEELYHAVSSGGSITLSNPITMTQFLNITTDVVIDLAGNSLSVDDSLSTCMFQITEGVSFTLHAQDACVNLGAAVMAFCASDDQISLSIHGGTYTTSDREHQDLANSLIYLNSSMYAYVVLDDVSYTDTRSDSWVLYAPQTITSLHVTGGIYKAENGFYVHNGQFNDVTLDVKNVGFDIENSTDIENCEINVISNSIDSSELSAAICTSSQVDVLNTIINVPHFGTAYYVYDDALSGIISAVNCEVNLGEDARLFENQSTNGSIKINGKIVG